MRGKNLRIVIYSIFLIVLLLLASRLVLLFPIGGWGWGGSVGITDSMSPISISWDPNMNRIGVYGKTNDATNPWYEYILWNWKDEFHTTTELATKLSDRYTFFLYNAPQYLTDTKWSPKGTYIAETFNLSSDGVPDTFQIRKNNDFILIDNSVPIENYSTLAWYPDESKILLADFNASLFLWDLNDNTTITKIQTNLSGNIKQMGVSSNGDYMFTVDVRNGTLVLSLSSTGSQTGTFLDISHNTDMTWVQWMSFTNNDLLFFENGTQIYYYNPTTGDTTEFLNNGNSFDGVFAGKSHYLGYVQNDTIYIYDFTAQKFLDSYEDENPIHQIAVSPDEQYIAYITTGGIYVRSLKDFALIKYLPPGVVNLSGYNYIGIKTFQTMELIILFIVFGTLELFFRWLERRKMLTKAESSDSVLYPDAE